MTITADFSGGEKTATTEPLYQWDTGQKLALSGLPQTASDIQVHFANAAMAQAIVKATELVDSLPTCDIPNEFLQFGSAAKARAWVFYRTSNTEGYTVRTVLIPVTPRKRPNDYVSPEDPDSKGIVERAIELLEHYQSDLDGKLDDADGSVKENNIADESITVEKVADDLAAVINAKMDAAPGAVKTANIDDGAVTAAKLGTGAVTGAKIGGKEVKTANIDDGAVTTNQLGLGAVTLPKLGTGVIDSTLAVQGAAADAKVTGDAVSALNKEINELDDYVMPNTILDFEDNISILSGLTVSSVSKTRLVATSGSNTIADYIPITLIANKEYLFYFDFSTTDGENVNIRFYENDKSTLIKTYRTNKEMYHYTPSSSSTIYLRLYFLNADSTLTVKDSFVGLYSEYGNLIGKIGNPQLTADMQSLISNLTKKTYNHKSELNVLNDYVLPTNLIDFESNESALSGLAIQKISKTTLKASRPSNDASAEYWIPISVQSGAYKFKFTFTSEDGGNLNIRLFDTNKSTQLKAFSTSNKVEEFTFTESKTVYIRLYFLSLNKVLDITDSIIAPSAVFNEYLSQKIGYKQLADDLSQYWVKIEDKFDISATVKYSGVTDSKDGNEISLTTTADSSYIIYDLTCDENKKYVLYYDLTGTYTGGNYSFQVRLLSTSFTSFIETISQTSGASASGTILINPGTGDGGKFSINMPNVNGQSISGDLYIYDVTNLSQEQIDSVDWENVGESALIFTGSSGGSLSNSWSGKKVVFYGDSITQTSYPEKVQAKLGFTLVKNAYGGSRFGYASSAHAFSDDTRISELPTDADVVCIMGGTNDWQRTEIETTALAYNDGFDRTKLKGAIAYTVQKIQARCTSARVYLLTNIGGRGNSDPTVIQPLPQVAPSGVGAGNTPLMVRNAMIEVAEELNIPVIDTWSCGINGFNRGTYIADTVHPTNAGQIVIAEYIVNALMNDAPW